MRRSKFFAVLAGLAVATVAGNAGCITITQRYSLVDVGQPRSHFEEVVAGGTSPAIVGAVGASVVGAPLCWLLYRWQLSRLRRRTAAERAALADHVPNRGHNAADERYLTANAASGE